MSVPAARTFESLKDSILNYLKLKDDTTADSLAGDVIRSGLISLSAYPIKSMRATTTINLSTTSHTFTLPADFNMPYSFFLLDSNGKRDGRIVYRREEEFDFIQERIEGIAGVPEMYTIRQGERLVELSRTPSSVAVHSTALLRYYKRVDVLSTGTSTFSVEPEVGEYLIWYGRMQLAPIYDAKMYPLAMQEMNRSLRVLIKRNTEHDEMDWT
jgi:hypothetical protein